MCAARRVLRDGCCDRNGMFGLVKQSKVSFHRHARFFIYLCRPATLQDFRALLASMTTTFVYKVWNMGEGIKHARWMIHFHHSPSTTKFKPKTTNPRTLLWAEPCVAIPKVACLCHGGKDLFVAFDDGKSVVWARRGGGETGRYVILSMKTAHRLVRQEVGCAGNGTSPIFCIYWHSHLCSSILPAQFSPSSEVSSLGRQ